MMISPILVVQATLALACLAEGYTFLQHPYIFHPALFQPVEANRHRQIPINQGDAVLPCPGEAFFVHPSNCSRFYRCVDYTGTGGLFSRYLFECPTNHVFITAVQTCLPGFCPPSPQAVDLPTVSTPHSTTSVSSTESPVFPVVPETESPFPIKPIPVEVSTTTVAVSTFPNYPTAFPTEAPPVTTLGPFIDVNPQDEPCPDKYVQHPDFCNVYTPCNEPSVRYVCPGGTAFDQSRQMCRISAFDDGLCNLKKVFEHPFLLRSENIGTHVRLPDYIYVPTSRPFQGTSTGIQIAPAGYPSIRTPGSPTPSPVSFYLFPTSRPSGTGVDFSFSNFGIEQNALRPVFSRPAQIPRRQYEGSSSPKLDGTYNILRPVGVEAAPPAATKFRPLEQVRRPHDQLHFSSFHVPQFGYHREIV